MQDSMLFVGMQDKIVNWPIPAEFDSALPLQSLLPVKEGLKNEFLHGWRYIGFGPDRKLYVAPNAPNLAGENAGYIVSQSEVFNSGRRSHAQKSIIATGLNNADIRDLAQWYSLIKAVVIPPDLE